MVAAGWQPCGVDEGARMESRRIVMKVVDYIVDEFWRENARGHGKRWNPEQLPRGDWLLLALLFGKTHGSK